MPGRRSLDHGRASQPRVDVGEMVRRDPDAGVLHAEDHRPVPGPFGADDDGRALRRLRRGVVQQFGEDVADVVGCLANQHDIGQRRDPGPAVLGDLRDRRAHHVEQRHRLDVGAFAVVPRQHQQVLAVAAHPRGQVVDPEQQLELPGVRFPAFHLLYHVEEGLDQREIAHGQSGQDPVQRFTVGIVRPGRGRCHRGRYRCGRYRCGRYRRGRCGCVRPCRERRHRGRCHGGRYRRGRCGRVRPGHERDRCERCGCVRPGHERDRRERCGCVRPCRGRCRRRRCGRSGADPLCRARPRPTGSAGPSCHPGRRKGRDAAGERRSREGRYHAVAPHGARRIAGRTLGRRLSVGPQTSEVLPRGPFEINAFVDSLGRRPSRAGAGRGPGDAGLLRLLGLLGLLGALGPMQGAVLGRPRLQHRVLVRVLVRVPVRLLGWRPPVQQPAKAAPALC